MCFLRIVWLLVLSFSISSLVNFICVDSNTAVHDERDALIAFKDTITNNYDCTYSWDGNLGSACTWSKIDCDSDGRVIGVILPGNNFLGSIPPEFGNLVNLVQLDLSHNSIGGEIPRELGSLHKLTQLLLPGNAIQGTIPPELGNLISLTNLELDDNFLEGSIPYDLTKLKNLVVLDLSSNNLNGAAPENLPQIFPSVTKVNLTYNKGPGERGGLSGDCTQVPCCYYTDTRDLIVCKTK